MSFAERRRSSHLTEDEHIHLENKLHDMVTQERRGSNLASKLHATARSLERNMIADSLNQQLYSRDYDQMQAVMRGGDVAPRIRSSVVSLERAMKRDAVGRALEGRPEPEEMMKKGIIQSGVSSKIQGIQRRLSQSMTTDKLGQLLEQRPEFEDLQTAGIIKDNSVAPAIQGAQKQLERNLAKSNLYHALSHRPSITELQDAGTLPDDYNPYPYDHAYEYLQHDAYDYDDDEGDDDEDDYDTYEYYPDAAQEQFENAEAHVNNFDDGVYGNSEDDEDEEEEEDELQESLHQRRSKNFHLTRLLLKHISSLAMTGAIDNQQKSILKDLTVDQDSTILAVAESFDVTNDLADFQDSLVRLTYE